jgi:hypothetical protein
MGIIRQEIPDKPDGPTAPPGPGGPRPPQRPIPNTPATKLYEAKPGFANHYFNKLEQKRLLDQVHKQGDFGKVAGDWSVRARGRLYAGEGKGKPIFAEMAVKDRGAKDGKNDLVVGIIDGLDYKLEPLNDKEQTSAFKDPPESGGLLLALYQYRQMLTLGPKGFVGEFSHGGTEPFYPPPANKEKPEYTKLRVDAEVLRTKHAGVPGKWYFSTKEETRGQLLGFEVTPDRDEDPCEVYLSDYKDVGGRKLPGRIEVRYGDKTYAVLNEITYKLDAAK